MKEPHEQIKNGNVIKFLKDYWFILLAIIAMASAWATTQAQIQANTIVNEKQEERLDMQAAALTVLDKQYTEDISIIKTKLDQLTK